MSEAMNSLPPELQARINNILSEHPQVQPQAQPQPSPEPQRAPSLMDHTIALRQEVAQLSSQVRAIGQVTEAVGQAVGELYQLFSAQTTSNFSSNFQEDGNVESDY